MAGASACDPTSQNRVAYVLVLQEKIPLGVLLMAKYPKPIHELVELHARACALVRAAGFELHCISSKTEATYFRLPGRTDLLRIAYHKSHGPTLGLNRVSAKITFGQDAPKSRPGTMRLSDGAFLRLVALRIGEYMISPTSQQEHS